MNDKLSLDWLIAAGTRALRTMAQTALGMFTVGMAFNEIQWAYIVSVAVVSGIYSMLTSLATKLPEVGTDGILKIDTSNPTKDTYRLAFDAPLETLSAKKTVKLSVDSKADLSQE